MVGYQTLKKSVFKFSGAAVLLVSLAACQTTNCLNVFNDPQYSSRTHHKAMALGGGRCYWVSDRATPDQARSHALLNCQKTNSNCKIVSVGNKYVGNKGLSNQDLQNFRTMATMFTAGAVTYQANKNGQTVDPSFYNQLLNASNGNTTNYNPSVNYTSSIKSQASGSCRQREMQLNSQVRQYLQQSYGNTKHLICLNTKRARDSMYALADLYKKCRILDTTGSKYQQTKQAADGAAQTVRTQCVR